MPPAAARSKGLSPTLFAARSTREDPFSFSFLAFLLLAQSGPLNFTLILPVWNQQLTRAPNHVEDDKSTKNKEQQYRCTSKHHQFDTALSGFFF